VTDLEQEAKYRHQAQDPGQIPASRIRPAIRSSEMSLAFDVGAQIG
jgi:hypothetical protein